MDTIEKRQHPRVTASFPLRMGPLASASVRDVSLAGVRCLTSDPIAAMTVVSFLLEIPTGDDEQAFYEVPCDGVVVRCDPAGDNPAGDNPAGDDPAGDNPAGDSAGFDVAILFQELSVEAFRFLEAYVDNRLRSTDFRSPAD